MRIGAEAPLSCTFITLVLTSRAGLGVSPLIVVAVVVGYLAIESLSALHTAATAAAPTDGSASASGPRAKGRIGVEHRARSRRPDCTTATQLALRYDVALWLRRSHSGGCETTPRACCVVSKQASDYA
jgi:hypothetical protein